MVVTTDVDYHHINEFFYLPVADVLCHLDQTRSDISKQTHVLDKRDFSIVFTKEEDLLSLKPDVFREESEEDTESVDRYVPFGGTDDKSVSSIYLYDEEREFRIVDPAMEYLLNKTKRGFLEQQSSIDANYPRDSMDSSSSDINAYYGRPSWSVHTEKKFTAPVAAKDHPIPIHKERLPYNGPEDGFKISLFALHPDLDDRYAFDLLETAFECYPDKQYCLLSLPTSYQGSPLTRHFVRLTPKLCRDFPHELYMAHRNSVFSDFSVRPLSLVDYDPITELVEHVASGRKVRRAIVNCQIDDSDGSVGYVLECEGCIVGVAVISKDFALQEMQPHYRLEEVLSLNCYGWERHGLLRHVLVSVAFLRAAPFFLRQIMHQEGLDTLSYCLLTTDLITKGSIPLRPCNAALSLYPHHCSALARLLSPDLATAA
ncbi:Cilia and flagella associated protein 61 [Homalodisca vitripennis]|nr:Cilia and flagella associated protein 61 [Homalodisca vitripennis]